MIICGILLSLARVVFLMPITWPNGSLCGLVQPTRLWLSLTDHTYKWPTHSQCEHRDPLGHVWRSKVIFITVQVIPYHMLQLTRILLKSSLNLSKLLMSHHFMQEFRHAKFDVPISRVPNTNSESKHSLNFPLYNKNKLKINSIWTWLNNHN